MLLGASPESTVSQTLDLCKIRSLIGGAFSVVASTSGPGRAIKVSDTQKLSRRDAVSTLTEQHSLCRASQGFHRKIGQPCEVKRSSIGRARE
jgi:hypothetical protein